MAVLGDRGLAPIRLQLQAEGREVDERFCWDPCTSATDTHKFALGMCQDMGLPPQPWAQVVTGKILKQAKEYIDQDVQQSTAERLEPIRC